MNFLLCLTIVITTSLASPAPQDYMSILKSAGATDRFGGVVGHGIHSMTLQVLRRFKPDITQHNTVPTVNMDLKSDQPILFYAPNGPEGDTSFKTEAMRTVDQVLSHMDNGQYDIKQYSPLERLVHNLHMKEVWNNALLPYQALKVKSPSADVCKCARDIENNGILTNLRYIALELREPELMYNKLITSNNGTVTFDSKATLYKYYFFVRDASNGGLRKADEVIPQLKNEGAWGVWKKLMKTMLPGDDFELALYLYCALNK